MTMVERVARAILRAHAGDIPVHDADLQWSWWIDEAHAAIEAMEPTDAMVAAACADYERMMGEPEGTAVIASILRAAHAAALSEGEG